MAANDVTGTDAHWESWGRRDAYFSVLTDPRFRAAAITAEAMAEFFASGQWHVDHVLRTCRQQVDGAFLPRRVLDFGCGVGRLVIPFAQLAEHVVGVDVSPSMLAEARRNCVARDIGNVALVLSDDALSQVQGQFDLVHTCIVLQHLEVQRGRALFAQLVDRIAPGGLAAIQVTYAWDRFADRFGQPPPASPPAEPVVRTGPAAERGGGSRLRRFFGGSRPTVRGMGTEATAPAAATSPQAPDPEMQMNYYNLSELMFIVQRAGATSVHMEFTDHGGALGTFLYFKKPIAN